MAGEIILLTKGDALAVGARSDSASRESRRAFLVERAETLQAIFSVVEGRPDRLRGDHTGFDKGVPETAFELFAARNASGAFPAMALASAMLRCLYPSPSSTTSSMSPISLARDAPNLSAV